LNFPPVEGGIATHCFQVAKYMSRLGEDVLVIAPDGPGAREFDAGLDFNVYRMPSLRSRYLRFLVTSLYALLTVIRHRRVDCLYSTLWRNSGLPAWLVSKVTGVPYFQAVHGTEVMRANLGPGLRWLFALTAGRARKLIALGEYEGVLLGRLGIPQDRVIVVPEGVDPEEYLADRVPDRGKTIRRKYGLDGRKVILTVGRLVRRKGHDMVIRALPQVLETVPEVVYLIVGRGSEQDDLRQLAEEMGVQDKVIFAGFVPDEELLAYYELCDAFIMMSREEQDDVEGFGIVFVEANACGKPVIGGRSGGVSHAIQDGITGVLVDPCDVGAIRSALVEVLTNHEFAARLGGNGRRRVEQELNYAVIARRIREVMAKELLSLHSAGASSGFGIGPA